MTTDEGTSVPDNRDDLGPSPAELGDTMTVAPGEWTPLDDLGTQIYVYGDQPVDIAVQRAEADDEVRHLREELAALAKGLLEIAEAAMPDTYLATDSRVQRARRALGTVASVPHPTGGESR